MLNGLEGIVVNISIFYKIIAFEKGMCNNLRNNNYQYVLGRNRIITV